MFENDSNIITLKLKYSTDENSKTRILEYIKNYNNVLHFTYNRLHENKDLKTKEITVLQKTMKNIFVDSHFKNSAIFDSKSLLGNEKVIFGGKKLFIDRCQNKISKEEFQLKKLRPIYSVGKQFSSFQELYDKVKKSKVRYRFPLENCSYAVFRKKHIKTYQTLYKFV